MKPLDRKLLRDLWRLRSQVITIALVVASGIGGYIGSLSAHASLAALRDGYYESARFAHVFAPVRRAPARHSPGEKPGTCEVAVLTAKP